MVKNKKMENGEITYMVKLTFHEDEERQVKEFNLTVPASVELMRVVDVLSEEHEKLTAELPFGKYGFVVLSFQTVFKSSFLFQTKKEPRQ